eukprot:SAG31_NODE_38717_length_294_cov_0.512821_1_plen_55_part_01
MEDDPPRSRPSTGAHAQAASSPGPRSAGQPIVASRSIENEKPVILALARGAPEAR